MRWRGQRESKNVEDRRGQSQQSGIGLPIKGKGGILMFVVVLVAGYYGVDLSPLLNSDSMSPTQQEPYKASQQEQEAAQFTSVILGLTEDSWQPIFRQMGKNYSPPKLVIYTRATRTSCGTGQAMMGPFYCPADETVYIDLSFYQEMKQKLGGGGDFAQAYVIAHEVGHHVQHLLGTNAKVRQMQQGKSKKVVNQLSVAMELQADCYAGVWGSTLKGQNILEENDLETALRTAQAIGDDRLQQQSQGYVVPDSFTHGTSQQRYDWFMRGFKNGDVNQCNTFN